MRIFQYYYNYPSDNCVGKNSKNYKEKLLVRIWLWRSKKEKKKEKKRLDETLIRALILYRSLVSIVVFPSGNLVDVGSRRNRRAGSDFDGARRNFNFAPRTISISPFLSAAFVKYVPTSPSPQSSLPSTPAISRRLQLPVAATASTNSVSFSTCYGQRDAPHVIPDCLSNY